MARLPIIGSDDNQWGVILNEYLLKEHNADGTLKSSPLIAGAQQKNERGQPDGYVPLGANGKVPSEHMPVSPVSGATATTEGVIQLAGDLSGTAGAPTVPGLTGKYDFPGGGIPESDLSATVQSKLNYSGPTETGLTTAPGDLIIGDALGAPTRLGAGTDNQALVAESAAGSGVSWNTISGGPAHAVASEGVTQAQRSVLDFAGSGVEAANGPGAATTVTVLNEYLNVADPRWGVAPNDTNDQAAKIQAVINAAAASGRGTVYFAPGNYVIESTLVIPGTTSMRILGAGTGDDGKTASTSFRWHNDLGAGRYAMTFDGNTSAYRMEKIILVGPSKDNPTGSMNNLMGGVLCSGRGILEDVAIQGFGPGLTLHNSYQEFHTCRFQGNAYCVQYIEGDSYGFQTFDRCFLTDASRAAFLIPNGTTMANVRLVQGHIGFAPYCIMRVGGSTNPRRVFMENVVFENQSFENNGNGAIYDQVGDGEVTRVIWKPAGESGAWTGPKWPGEPTDRANIDVGHISHCFWYNGHPTKDSIRHGIKAISMKYLYFDDSWIGAYQAGSNLIARRPFLQAPGGTAADIEAIRMGQQGKHAGADMGFVVFCAESIGKYDLVEIRNGQMYRCANTASSVVAGVALDDYVAGDIGGYRVRGTSSSFMVKNQSGVAISGGGLLKPDPAHPGCVMRATSWGDGQVLGRVLQTVQSGSSGQAEVWL